MTNTDLFTPTISVLLEEFFRTYRSNAKRDTRERIRQVRAHLSDQLETQGPRELTTPQIAILETEKQFTTLGAFARTMRAPELYFVLGTYLRPEFAMEGILLRETQLDIVAALALSLWRRRLIGVEELDECAVVDFDVAMKRARAAVRKVRRDASRGGF